MTSPTSATASKTSTSTSPQPALTSGSITDTLVTPYGDYDLSNLFSGSNIVPLDPGAAFGLGADTASAATEAATNIDPLSFLGL